VMLLLHLQLGELLLHTLQRGSAMLILASHAHTHAHHTVGRGDGVLLLDGQIRQAGRGGGGGIGGFGIGRGHNGGRVDSSG